MGMHNFDEDMCSSRDTQNGFGCGLIKGHSGPHVGYDVLSAKEGARKYSPAPWSWGMAAMYGQVLSDSEGRHLLSLKPGAIHNTRRGDDALIAAAPEMRDMLLSIEWSGNDGHDQPGCPVCGGHAWDPLPTSAPYPHDLTGKHEPGCELGALLERIR